jgi:hypothetical protein
MKPFVHVLFAAGLAATTALGAQALSLHNGPAAIPSAFDHGAEPFPAPVSAGVHPAESGSDGGAPATCLPVAQILGIFALDVEAVGGEILALSDGLEQDFADQWRQAVGLSPVDVAQVFAHVVPTGDGDAIVDVVEVDAEGCALSRTLLSETDWLTLLGVVTGIEV